MLELNDVSVSYQDTFSLKNISFRLDDGDWLMVIGPNGAGKSTMVKTIAGSLNYNGAISYMNQEISQMRAKEKARAIGILQQRQETTFDYTVEEIVALGRYAYRDSIFASQTIEDEAAIDQALEKTGIEKYRKRSMHTLSGGEQQRAYLAQVFAQDPNILILDEPANHLDLAYQEIIFDLIAEWLQAEDRAVISIVHDLTTAKLYGNRALLLNQGKMEAEGTVSEVMTSGNLDKVYQTDVYQGMQQRAAVWMEHVM
jgi:iron complex transport system ATP-binding protein